MQLSYRRLNGADAHEAGRQLLAELLGYMPQIQYAKNGKPYIPGGPFFSVSHTKNHVFCAVSDRNIGIDAEETDRIVRSSFFRILSPAEKERCGDDRAALLRLWVLKESWAKYTGRGIGNYLKNTDFDPFDPAIQEIDGCYVAVMEE